MTIFARSSNGWQVGGKSRQVAVWTEVPRDIFSDSLGRFPVTPVVVVPTWGDER